MANGEVWQSITFTLFSGGGDFLSELTTCFFSILIFCICVAGRMR